MRGGEDNNIKTPTIKIEKLQMRTELEETGGEAGGRVGLLTIGAGEGREVEGDLALSEVDWVEGDFEIGEVMGEGEVRGAGEDKGVGDDLGVGEARGVGEVVAGMGEVTPAVPLGVPETVESVEAKIK